MTATTFEVREVCEADLPVLYEHQRDPEACRLAAFDGRARDAFMTHWRGILADVTTIKRAVLVDGRVAGYAVCFRRSGLLQVGYWIGREFWGRGAATHAVERLVRAVDARPLYAFVAPDNVGSQRVLEKCGFVRSDESLVDVDGPVDADDDLLYRLGPRTREGE